MMAVIGANIQMMAAIGANIQMMAVIGANIQMMAVIGANIQISGSQTSSGRVPFAGPVFSPRTILKPPCSRKTQSTQYHSIKSLAKHT